MEGHVVRLAVTIHFHVQSGAQGIDHGGAHAVQATAGLVRLIVKFSARMQGRQIHALRGYSFLVHFHRNAASAVLDCTGTVCLQRHPDGVAESGQMLIYRIVHDLIN